MGRIGIVGDNSVEFIEKIIEIWNNGDCAVLIDWRIPSYTIMQMLKDATALMCFVDSKVQLKEEDVNEFNIKVIRYTSKNCIITLMQNRIYGMYQPNYSGDEAAILYSSGTTGKAKGVILSHKAINTNADMILDYMKLSKKDNLIIVKSLTHASTFVGELLVSLKSNKKLYIAPTLSTPKRIFECINENNITTLCMNPTLLDLYTLSINSCAVKTVSLTTIYTSGAIANESLVKKAQASFPMVEILNVYGLSEAGPRVSAQVRGDSNNVAGSVGKPLRGIEVVIYNSNNAMASSMEKGVIHVKTPCLFKGYVNDKDKSYMNYCDLYSTGDIGYINNNGHLFITGRVDDMITISSHNVYPEEIEAFLLTNSQVMRCVIIPYKNIRQGNIIICYYEADHNISEDLRSQCRAYLPPYEIPIEFIKLTRLPISRNGKIIRSVSCYPYNNSNSFN